MKAFVMFLAVAIGAVAAIAASQDAAAAAPSGDEAKSEITAVYGTVITYEPGRSITVAQPDRKTVIYAIDGHSALPASLARGRRVVVRSITRPGLEQPLVRKVTYTAK